MLARKIGKNIIPVVEKFTELEADRHATPRSWTSGRSSACASSWPAAGPAAGGRSAGYRSKFGLTLTEVLEAFEYLKARGMADCLQLIHFHLGSQITNIRKVKDALTEAARVYVELHRVGAGRQVHRRRRRPGHRLRRLADRLRVERQLHAAGVRQRRRLPHQERLRRGRRAAPDHHLRVAAGRWSPTTACWSSTCSARPTSTATRRRRRSPDDAPQPIHDLFGIYRDLNKKNFLESYHDAVQADGGGAEPVQPRATCRSSCGPWPSGCSGRSCSKLQRHRPRAGLRARRSCRASRRMLSDTYFCNFSVFQSMPD